MEHQVTQRLVLYEQLRYWCFIDACLLNDEHDVVDDDDNLKEKWRE
jgi:hypothetical protein